LLTLITIVCSKLYFIAVVLSENYPDVTWASK